ncbi:site-specific integrase [Candidatus Pacearchaeota archaeon]|nr:site-specific integrase [Candidatus Pacearchaeota archaeon]
MLNYWPQGRYGRRIYQPLPENVTTARQAREIEALLQKTRHKKQEAQPARPSNTLVNTLFPKYLDDHSAIYHTPATHTDIWSCYNAHYKPILGAMRVEDTDTMELYIKLRKAEGAAHRTINKELDYFSGFRKWLKKKYGIAAPVERPERLSHKRPLPQILGITEVVKILAHTEPFYRAFFLALFISGLRMNEVRQLRWQDIDLKNRILRAKQKGGSFKILPVSDLFIDALVAIRMDDYAPDRFVFLNERTKKPIGQVRKALARACTAAGIERHVYPHLFRHSVATFLMGENFSMRKLQNYMGHSKIGTTEFYTHVNVDDLRAGEEMVTKAMKAAMRKDKSTTNHSGRGVIYSKSRKGA